VIQIFRKNWFVFTLLLFPYTLLTRLWVFFGTANWPVNTEQLSPVYRYVENFLPEEYLWNVILASFLVFINAAQINHIVIKNRISREINLFPGMVFILLSALHKDMFWVSPQLIALTLLLPTVSNIFRIYQKPQASRYLFNSGFFLALSSIFYLPFTLFILFCLAGIVILRKLQLRDFVQLLIGYFLVFFIITFLRFWNNLDYSPFLDFENQLHWSFGFQKYYLNEILVLLLVLFFIIISIINYRKFTIKKSIQSQKKVNLIFWFMIIGLITIVFSLNAFIFPSLMIILVALSIFIGMIMSRYKNEAALELLHLFVLFFIIFSHFWF